MKKTAAKPQGAPRTGAAVEDFLTALKHPLKREIEEARRIILDADPRIGEAIKWNAPSFQTTVFFATANLRAHDRVEFIFHKGAKKEAKPKDMAVPDPKNLLKWLAKDRALVNLGSGKDFTARKAAFAALVRAWIKQL
jgi:hypothetical protein